MLRCGAGEHWRSVAESVRPGGGDRYQPVDIPGGHAADDRWHFQPLCTHFEGHLRAGATQPKMGQLSTMVILLQRGIVCWAMALVRFDCCRRWWENHDRLLERSSCWRCPCILPPQEVDGGHVRGRDALQLTQRTADSRAAASPGATLLDFPLTPRCRSATGCGLASSRSRCWTAGRRWRSGRR